MPRKPKPQTRRATPPTNDCIVAVISDTHGASKLAPINPATRLDDLSTHKPLTIAPTAASELVWASFGVEWPAEAAAIADGRPVDIRHTGDVVQGNRHPEELYVTSPAHQVEIARMQLDPWLRLPGVRSVRFVAGTGVHEFGEGAGAQLLASEVRSRYTKIGAVDSAYHYLDTIAGVRFDLAHHGPGAGRYMWSGNAAARNYALDIVRADVRDGYTPPDVIVRGHVHTPLREAVWDDYLEHLAWMIVAPAMQYPNDYARNRGRSPGRFCFGVTLFDIRGGKIHGAPIKLWRTVDTRREVVTEG